MGQGRALVESSTVNGLTNIPVDFVNCYDRGLVPPVIFFVAGLRPLGGGRIFKGVFYGG
jgi:hypothetical protein